MMMIEGVWIIYQLNVAPFTFTAQLYTVAPSGLVSQNFQFQNVDLESLRSRIPPGSHRVVVTGPTVPAGNTLVEAWI